MTKKHFISLADQLRRIRPTQLDFRTPDALDGAILQWEITRDALANFCRSQNSEFKRERWLAYIAGECGPNGGRK